MHLLAYTYLYILSLCAFLAVRARFYIRKKVRAADISLYIIQLLAQFSESARTPARKEVSAVYIVQFQIDVCVCVCLCANRLESRTVTLRVDRYTESVEEN